MSKLIKYCVYRFIEIPVLCSSFMDTSIFQRLRRIKQLGLSHYVYPSAVHTRFEHSLGVMHLSGEVIERLRKYKKISQREKILVQLAGMLHDVGHLAFSHLFDLILERISVISPSLKSHENRSLFFVREMNSELNLLTEKEENMVCSMIKGDIYESDRAFLYEIVCNARNGLDVDKMDYIQRDAYHTGLPGFQPDYIIRNLVLTKDNHIAVKKKAKQDVDDLYLTRKRMFTNVYYHKVNLKIEKIYVCLIGKEKFLQELQKMPITDWDDYAVEILLRQLFPAEMEVIDKRKLEHSCNECENFSMVRTPKLNGHISGDGQITYLDL